MGLSVGEACGLRGERGRALPSLVRQLDLLRNRTRKSSPPARSNAHVAGSGTTIGLNWMESMPYASAIRTGRV